MPFSANISIGGYYHRNSPVHRLDPRTKLLGLLLLTGAVFLVRTPWGFLVIVSFLTGMILLAHLPPRVFLHTLQPMTWLLASIMILHILFTDGGFKPSLDGVYRGVWVGCRFLLIVMGASVLTLTTLPLRLADGTARMLNPLRKAGLPVHQFPIMMVIVLHFVPNLSIEAEKLSLAQKARGAQLDRRNILRRLKSLTRVLIPLIKSSFRQADELAMGMESRCYHGGDRSYLHELAFSKADGIALAAVAAIIPLTLMINKLV